MKERWSKRSSFSHKGDISPLERQSLQEKIVCSRVLTEEYYSLRLNSSDDGIPDNEVLLDPRLTEELYSMEKY